MLTPYDRSIFSRRLFGWTMAICLLAAPAAAALGGDLDGDPTVAFTAVYQQPPPLVRTIYQPIYATGRMDHPQAIYKQSAVLAAARLVKLHGHYFALLVSETVQDVGHTRPGSYSVAYVTLNGTAWHLERLWPELITLGQTGIPADRTWNVQYGAEPLIIASSTYCGMGACGETIVVVALGREAPRVLGTLEGGFDNDNDSRAPNCPRQHYTATIGPPHDHTEAFSVTYVGWTTGEHGTTPKRALHRQVDYVASAKGLTATPPQRPWCW